MRYWKVYNIMPGFYGCIYEAREVPREPDESTPDLEVVEITKEEYDYHPDMELSPQKEFTDADEP